MEALVVSLPRGHPLSEASGNPGNVNFAFNGLLKFKGNPLAREYVLEALQTGKDLEVNNSFRVLTEWRERLSNTELEVLLQNSNTKLGTLHYIGLIQIPIVFRLLSNTRATQTQPLQKPRRMRRPRYSTREALGEGEEEGDERISLQPFASHQGDLRV